jgi:polar amino acid transport system permease protein
MWQWDFALEILPELLYAFFRYTLVATVLGTALAAVLGLAFAIIRRLNVPVLAPLTTGFIEFIRSTPLLVQLFFLFFVLPEFGVTIGALTTGVIGLGVHYACYLAEVYRAGIEGVPKGQWEATTALSLPHRLQWQHVILPQAIRNVLPALGNYAISMFKETPFLALITVPEMVHEALAIGSITFRYIEPLTLAGLIFLLASYPTAIALRKVEVRLGH